MNNLSQVNKEIIDQQIRPLLTYTEAWEVKSAGFLIGSGKSSDLPKFDTTISDLEDKFNRQQVTIRMGQLDSNGNLKSNSKKWEFIIVGNDHDNSASLILQPINQPTNQLNLSGFGKGNQHLDTITINGLIDNGVDRATKVIESELKGELNRKVAELDAQRIIDNAKLQEERMMDKIERERKDLERDKEEFNKKKEEFAKEEAENTKTIKGVVKTGLGGLIDFIKEFVVKDDNDGLAGTTDKKPEDTEEFEEASFEEVTDTQEDTTKKTDTEAKTKLAKINERAKEITQEDDSISFREAQQIASQEFKEDEISN